MNNSNPSGAETNPQIRLNDEAIRALTETRKWTTFFGILGIIVICIIVLSAAVMIFVLPFLNEDINPGFPPFIAGLLYLFLAGVYILPVIYLMRFSSFTRKAISLTDELMMGQAMKNLTLHFRVAGIITLVFIALYILLIITMVIFGMGMFAGNLIGA